MNAELQFGWAEEHDIAEICTFMADGFGADSVQANKQRVQWLYFSNPHGLHISICRHNNQLVAVCPHVLQQVSLAGRTITAAFGIDFFVTSNWRKKGIASKFLEMRRDRFELSLSTGQSPAMYNLYLKVGAKDLGTFKVGYGQRRLPAPTNLRAYVRKSLTWLKYVSTKRSTASQRYADIPFEDAQQSLNPWQLWRYGPASPYQDYRLSGVSPTQAQLVTRRANNVLHIIGLSANVQDRPRLLRSTMQTSQCDEFQIQFCGNSLMKDCSQAGFLIRSQDARLVAMTNDAELKKHLLPGCIDLMAETSDTDLMRSPLNK